MAFPSVRTKAATAGTTASSTPVITLPATISAGDTILVVFRSALAGTVTWPGGGAWIELFNDASDGSGDVTACAWKKADGTEGGTTITLASGNGKFAACAYAIQDAADPTVTPPEFAALATGSSDIPDAGTCTPTGGAKDYLWVWAAACEGEQTVSPVPIPGGGYANGLAGTSGTGGAVTTNVRVFTADRQANAASENPGAATIDVADQWTATVIAFHPTAGGSSAALTGLSSTAAVGTQAPSNALTLSGVFSTGQIGSLGVAGDSTAALTGVSSTGAIGALGRSTTTALTTQSSSGAIGTLTQARTLTLVGQSTTGQVGTVAPSGGAGGDVQVALTGVVSTGAVGALGKSRTLALSGLASSAAVGSLTPSGGDVVLGVVITIAGVDRTNRVLVAA